MSFGGPGSPFARNPGTGFTGTPDTDPALTEGVLTRRIFAWLIDFVLIGMLVTLVWLGIATVTVLTFGLGSALLVILPAIPFAYHVLFVAGSWSATPGQAMLDLVVRRDLDGGQPGLLQAVIFTAGLWVTLGSAFLLLVIAPFTPRKRALHDIVAGVVVIRKHALTRGTASLNMGIGTPYR